MSGKNIFKFIRNIPYSKSNQVGLASLLLILIYPSYKPLFISIFTPPKNSSEPNTSASNNFIKIGYSKFSNVE